MPARKSKEQGMAVNFKHLDYKDVETLRHYLSPHARILARRKTKLSAKSQRKLTQAVKRARFMGLLPYIAR